MDVVCADDVFGVGCVRRVRRWLACRITLPRLNGFLGVAPLPVGVIVLACFYWTIAIISILVNMMLYNPSMSFAFALIYISAIYMLLTWITAMLGIILVNLFKIKRALLMWTIFIIVWAIMVVFTFFEYGATLLCAERRCPDSFWMYNNTWYDMDNSKPEYRPPTAKDTAFNKFADSNEAAPPQRPQYDWESTPSLLSTIVLIAMQNDLRKLAPDDNQPQKGNDENSTEQPNPSTKKNDKDDQVDSPKRNTLNLVVLVFLVTINTVHLTYSWLIMFNCKLDIEHGESKARTPGRTPARKR